MGLRIKTIVAALNAQRNLGTATSLQKDSLEKLASGSRITKAADDAAGLAISEKLRADIRSLRQDYRNTQDGISMLQTAEGAMNEIGNILIRFRELSIQAASDTIGNTERGYVDREVQQLKQEIDRISKSTEFNGSKLLTAIADVKEIQVGIHNDPDEDRAYYDVMSTNMALETLGLGDLYVRSKEEAQQGLGHIDKAINRLSRTRATVGALQNRMVSTAANLQIANENLSGANSRIRDADMAQETTDLTRANLLADSGVAVLSQANSKGNLVLRLVQNV